MEKRKWIAYAGLGVFASFERMEQESGCIIAANDQALV